MSQKNKNTIDLNIRPIIGNLRKAKLELCFRKFRLTGLILLFSTICFSGFAQYGGGTGVLGNPYILSTPAHLDLFRTDQNNGATSQKYYKLANDIDYTNAWNTPTAAFEGNLDGDNHRITFLSIKSATTNPSDKIFGAFRQISNIAVVRNLGISAEINETRTSAAGDDILAAGIFAMNSYGCIENCYVEGKITIVLNKGSLPDGACRVGGFLSILELQGKLTNSYSKVTVDVTVNDGTLSASTVGSIGGFVGVCASDISKCYVGGNVSYNGGAQYNPAYIGGFAGSTDRNVVLTNCYAAGGTVTYKATNNPLNFTPSAFLGSRGIYTTTLINCYSSVDVSNTNSIYKGAITGSFPASSPFISSQRCYFDKTRNPGAVGVTYVPTTFVVVQANASLAGSTGLITTEMQDQSNFAGWDFTNVWVMGANYPELRSPSAFTQADTVPLPISICVGTSTTINLDSATGGTGATTYQWQQSANHGTSWTNILGANNQNYTTPTLASAQTRFYRRIAYNDCASIVSDPVIVTAIAIPTITETISNARCDAGTVLLGATSSTGTVLLRGSALGETVNWYSNSIGGILLGTGSTFITPSIATTTTYYAEAVNGSCVSSPRTPVTATVKANPTISASSSNVSVGSTITLSPTTGGTWISSNPSVATVTSAGIVAGISEGSAIFAFTDAFTTCSSTTGTIMVRVPFEIWNWEDLSQVPAKQAEGYTQFIVMQNIGTTVGTDAGNGNGPDGIQGTADDCPYTDVAKRAGSYGYENTSCGWDANGWKPMGNSTTPFITQLNGNNYAITGLYINRPALDNVGLFGYIGIGGEVKNLGIKNANIIANQQIGSISGYLRGGTVENCHNIATSNNTKIAGLRYVGGIVGDMSTGALIKNCSNTATVEGQLGGLDQGSYVGGIIARNNNSTVQSCYNIGEVKGYNYVGGVVGLIVYGTLEYSSNSGTVTGAASNVGGVVGQNWTGGSMVNCYNVGAVFGGTNVGGVLGQSYSGSAFTSQCYNVGAVTGQSNVGGFVGDAFYGTIKDCYNVGSVHNTASSAGGFAGIAQNSTLTNCFYDKNSSIMGDNAVNSMPRTGVAAIITADMIKESTFTGWIFDADKWSIDEGITYPYLSWQKGRVGIADTYVTTTRQFKVNSGTYVNCPAFGESLPSFADSSTITFKITNAAVNHADHIYNPYGTSPAFAGVNTVATVALPDVPASRVLVIGAMSESDIITPMWWQPDTTTFEIWNWEDLSQVAAKQAEGYTKFIVMQNIGITVGTDAGNGYGLDGIQGTADDCPYTDVAKRAGSYGYENTSCGWDANGWKPIGNNTTRFSGTFEGQNYTITGLWINRATTDYQGLFGSVQNSTIRTLSVKLEQIKGIKARYNAGSLVGYMGNNTLIDSCHAIGNLTVNGSSGILIGACGSLTGTILLIDTVNACSAQGNITGNSNLGGLIGLFATDNASSSLVVKNCHSKGNVDAAQGIVGGLIGQTRIAKISTSYSNADVKSGDTKEIGGFIGLVKGSDIRDCYSTGSVTGTPATANSMGGFATEWVIPHPSNYTNCYSIGAVLNGTAIDAGFLGAGQSNVTLTNCYFNTETSFKDVGSPNPSIHGTAQAMNTTQLTAALPTGFDPAIWEIVPGETYPYLKWQATRGLSNTYQVTGVTYSIDGGIEKPYGGPCVKLINIANQNVVFKVTNDNSERVYLSYHTDIFYPSVTVPTTPLTLIKPNQNVSIGFASESDIIGVRAPAVAGATLMGTVLPFVYDTTSDGTPDTEFNNLFPVIANLYAVPSVTTNDPVADIYNSTPLYTDTSIYYDGAIFVPGTPKNPGKIGLTNNPGLPINWAVLGKTQAVVDTTTLQQGETPSSPLGLYIFENVNPGDYVLVLSRSGYVTRFAKITINTDTVLGHRELIGGDVNNDLYIDPYDISKINAKRSQIGTPDYDPRYDINANGVIGAFDISLVLFYQGFYFDMYNDTWDWILGY